MFAGLGVIVAQNAKGPRLELILRLGRQSSPSVSGGSGGSRGGVGVDCAPVSLRSICSMLMDLSTPDGGGCCFMY